MSEKYLGEISTPLLINQIKEKCTQKRSTLPIASADELGNVYQYTGTTSGSLVHNYFYECVSDGAVTPTYSWQQVNVQPTAGTPTASGTTYDNTTSELQATNVQDAIDEIDGTVDSVASDVLTLQTDVGNIQDVVPSTATSSNKLIDHNSLGTAAFKDSTDRVSPNNTALVESQSVYSAINTALSSIYTPRGDITCAELTSSLLVDANVGNIYETSDSGTTTALFLQGAGHPIATGSNVGIINAGQGRILFNLMANAFDLTGYQKKDLTQAVEGATTVEGALGALSTNKATQAEVNDIVNVLGAKNLLCITASTSTVQGVTYTINTDGTIAVSASSASTGLSTLKIGELALKAGKSYILSGGISDNCRLDLRNQDSNHTTWTNNTDGKEVLSPKTSWTIDTFTPNADVTLDVYIRVSSGVQPSGTIYPMIRLASDPDNTYVPYAMTNQQITPYVQAISNPNLLDNPWFTVNQRGQSSYSGASIPTAFVDRWKMNDNLSCVVNADKTLTFTNSDTTTQKYFCNRFEHGSIEGKTVTLSILLSDNTIFTQTDIFPATTDAARDKTIDKGGIARLRLQNVAGFNQVVIFVSPNSNVTVKAVKLEIGTASTLENDTAPNYATELLKCQRYFVNVFLNKSSYAGPYFAIGDAGALYMNLPLAVPLRAIPTATLDSADIHILGEGASAIVTTCAVKAIYPNNVVVKIKIGDFVSTEFVPSTNGIYSLNFFDSNSCKFWLSADL